MDDTGYNRECHSNILTRNGSNSPERSENNSVRTQAKNEYVMGQRCQNSCRLYEHDVLKAYSIDPVATKEQNDFVLCKEEDGGRNNYSKTKHFQNLLVIERPLHSCPVTIDQLKFTTQCELTVLRAYRILPAQLF